jgi:hypothetical protein
VLVETQIKNHVLPSDEDLGFKNMWRKKRGILKERKEREKKKDQVRARAKGFIDDSTGSEARLTLCGASVESRHGSLLVEY